MTQYKVNFHCHSHFSDGDDMEKMVKEYKDNGFCCCIFTDHIYPGSIEKSFSNTRYKYIKQQVLGKELSKKYDIPVIVGAEVALYYEEFLVFNPETISRVFDIIDKNPKDVNVYETFFNELPKLLREANDYPILCHPTLEWGYKDFHENSYCNGMTLNKMMEILSLMKGYEKYNSGNSMFWEGREVPDILKDKLSFSNSDCHRNGCLKLGYNMSPIKIETWQDILKLTELENKIGEFRG